MCCDYPPMVTSKMRSFIRTCAAAGRLTQEAYASAAKSDGPADWLDTWLEFSKEYRGTRILFMCIFAETFAELARHLGIDCNADQIMDAPLDLAIAIDNALYDLEMGVQNREQLDT